MNITIKKYRLTRDMPILGYKKGMWIADVENKDGDYGIKVLHNAILSTWIELGYAVEDIPEEEYPPNFTTYFRINSRMEVVKATWTGSEKNKAHKKCKNFFVTYEEGLVFARAILKELEKNTTQI